MQRTSTENSPNAGSATATVGTNSNPSCGQPQVQPENGPMLHRSSAAVAQRHETDSEAQERVILETIAGLRLLQEQDRLPTEQNLLYKLQNLAVDTVFTPTLLSSIAVVIAYLCHHYHLGLAWALLLTAPILVSSLQVYIARQVRRGMRDFLAEQRNQRFPDSESVEWINHILALLWTNANLYIARTLAQTANEKLEKSPLPPMVHEIGVRHVDVGTRAPRLEYIQTHRNKNNHHQLVLDVKLEYNADDLQVEFYAQPKTVTGQTPTLNLLHATDAYFSTSIRLVIDLLPNMYPLASKITIMMLTKPEMDINVSALGHLVGVSEIPGIDGWLRQLLVDSVAAHLCPPNSFQIDLLKRFGCDDPDVLMRSLEQSKHANAEDDKKTILATMKDGAIDGAGKGKEVVGQGVGKGVEMVGKTFGKASSSSSATGSAAATTESSPADEGPPGQMRDHQGR